MSKHTPAPWYINPVAKRNVRHGDITIANCSSGQDGSREEEEIANAKLIAAAPELLEALIMCYKSLCTYGNHPIIEMYVEKTIKKATL